MRDTVPGITLLHIESKFLHYYKISMKVLWKQNTFESHNKFSKSFEKSRSNTAWDTLEAKGAQNTPKLLSNSEEL